MQLPQGFVEMCGRHAALSQLPQTLATEPTVSIRRNPRKADCGIAGTPVPWCAQGVYLDNRPQFTLDPALHQGRYYVQDASSMFIDAALRALQLPGPVAVLDACAAPGGKTTAAIDALPKGSLVVANEYVPLRAAILRENIIKWGYEGSIVTRSDTAAWRNSKALFDVIIADVPCSGEGMMRKDPQAAAQWSTALIDECVERQRNIIDNLWPVLRPGGYMIYSTCTFNTHENEAMLEFLANEYDAQPVSLPSFPGIETELSGSMPARRFIPGKVRGEGLFMAAVRKPGGNISPLAADTTLARLDTKDRVNLFPQIWLPLLRKIEKLKGVDILHHGIVECIIKGHDRVPTQSLAMATAPGLTDPYPRCEVDTTTALRYLRHEAVTLPADTPRGYILLTHGHSPLGFVKNLGNRANNLYPTDWRIRKL